MKQVIYLCLSCGKSDTYTKSKHGTANHCNFCDSCDMIQKIRLEHESKPVND